MSVTAHFNQQKAIKAGVEFTPVTEKRLIEIDADWGVYKEEIITLGYEVVCPDGTEGFAMMANLFQCKNMNQEIKSWFLTNVPGTHISY